MKTAPLFQLVACLLAIGLAPATRAQSGKKPFQPPAVGLELYSLREAMAKDVPGTLAKVRQMGFSEVEVPGYYGLTAEQFKRELDKAQLKPTSALFLYERLRDDVDNVIKEAKALGVGYVGCAWLPHQADFNRADMEQAVAGFKKSGPKLKANGIQLFYHPHGYEFRPTGQGTLFDEMVTQTAGVLAFEMDVFWAFHAGQDPVALLKKYPDRFVLLHLKDMKKGTPTGVHTGKAPDETNVAIGSGQLDFPAILRQAAAGGVKHYYIEDEAPEAIEQLPLSVRFLKAVR